MRGRIYGFGTKLYIAEAQRIRGARRESFNLDGLAPGVRASLDDDRELVCAQVMIEKGGHELVGLLGFG